MNDEELGQKIIDLIDGSIPRRNIIDVLKLLQSIEDAFLYQLETNMVYVKKPEVTK